MDKNAIRKFATEARRELISRVSQRALKFGVIYDKNIGDPDAVAVDGHILSDAEKSQRKALIKEIKEKDYEQVIEEVAYTWFNRFIALRFMEVNGYLPSKVRVFTDETNSFKPQILTEAIHLDMEGLNLERVYEFKEDNDDDSLYKYLIITQCNALNKVLPGMFQKISDYTELLFPDNILRMGSVISKMIEMIPEEDWKDAVQIIGWLYQYYISEKKDDVFAALDNKEKITKENIPAATQIFTPDWIVRYMVENSLGRIWQEGHPDEEMKAGWKYYIEEAKQGREAEVELEKTCTAYKNLKPEEIKCIDPCSGSGHILVYMFDILMEIYTSQGYNSRMAVESILENNLYGLDIDERATQLSYFAVMMKARQYDKRFLGRGISPKVKVILESNNIDKNVVDYFCRDDEKLKKAIDTILEEMHDAKEYGSIIKVSAQDWNAINERFDEIYDSTEGEAQLVRAKLQPLVEVAQILGQKYEVVVTNPPYVSARNMNAKLSEYVKKNYKDSKRDLCTVFIEKCEEMTNEHGFYAMITQHSWMFLSSFEKLRAKILNKDIINMAHLGPRAFEEIGGEVVQTTAFVIRNSHTEDYRAKYCRLIEPTTQQGKEELFLSGENRYIVDQSNFTKIPGSPVAYWASKKLVESFSSSENLKSRGDTRQGMATSDNQRFLRLWYEVSNSKIGLNFSNSVKAKESLKKWFPYNKGGKYRKWYGNIEYLINYENDGKELKDYAAYLYNSYSRTIKSISEYFKECLSWSKISSGDIAFRYYPQGFIFDVAGCCIFYNNKEDMFYDFGFVNSLVSLSILSAISPTLNYEAGHIASLPIIRNSEKNSDISLLTKKNINISKTDWDSFETSWDFKRHPLVRKVSTISEGFNQWKQECEERFQQLKSNEEELNRIFIDIYDLQDELTPEVLDKDVTVNRVFADKDDIPESMKDSSYARTKKDEIVSFISYAVGCMFGRYSLDMDGLAYAGGDWDESKYKTFKVDRDNIIPICDDDYFEDDIVGRFVKFVEVVYGEDTLDENLEFIADALGGKGQPKEVIRNYFLKDFYNDHCKLYQKRPIYWFLDSGKKNGFKCLIYMHRYQADLLARIRTDYVHEQQSRYRTAILDLQNRIDSASTSEGVKLKNKLKKLDEQSKEILKYEEKIHHLADQMISIDLDDGVVSNYAIFKDVLAKIK